MFWRDQEAHDGRHQGAAQAEAVSAMYRAHPELAAQFPDVSFERVVAYGYRLTKSTWLDEEMAGCETEALPEDGRLCPSVIANGSELSAEQAALLLKLSALPPSDRPLHFAYDPHHAFVFYDSRGIAVSHIGVCFECGEWTLDDAPRRAIPEAAYPALAGLCRELGMRDCPKNDTPPGALTAEAKKRQRLEREQQKKRVNAWLDSGAPERPSKALGIEPSRKLSDMSVAEQRLLCAWRSFETEGLGHLAYEKTKTRFRFQTYNECLETFPHCDVPLGEVENAAFHSMSDLEVAAPEACLHKWLTADTARCLWGIDTNPPRPDPPME